MVCTTDDPSKQKLSVVFENALVVEREERSKMKGITTYKSKQLHGKLRHHNNGSFGVVFRADIRINGNIIPVAAKKVDDIQKLKEEALLLSMFRSTDRIVTVRIKEIMKWKDKKHTHPKNNAHAKLIV